MFGQALREIIHRLEDARTNNLVQQYALVGGFAVSAWGVPRATHDLDFALALGSSEPSALASILKAEFHPPDTDYPLRGVFRCHLLIENHSIPVQLILLPPIWAQLVFRDLVTLSIFDCVVPVVSWESLVLLKLYAGGPQDLLDAQHILAVRQPTANEIQKMALLAEDVGLSVGFRSLIEHS